MIDNDDTGNMKTLKKLVMLLFNILINGYPIMLQRYNRIKLQELDHQPVAEAI